MPLEAFIIFLEVYMNKRNDLLAVTLTVLVGSSCSATGPDFMQRMQISYINGLFRITSSIACAVTNPKVQIGGLLLGGASLAASEIYKMKKASEPKLSSPVLSYVDAGKIFAKNMAVSVGAGLACAGISVFTLHSLFTWFNYSGWKQL